MLELIFLALNFPPSGGPTYILPVILRNAKPNNGRFRNRVSFSIKLAAFQASGSADKGLLALLPGFVALLVGFIVSLFFGFLVMIVQIAAGCAGDRANGQS